MQTERRVYQAQFGLRGPQSKLADAIIAESQSPARIALTARCRAYMEDEQAVSIVRLEVGNNSGRS